jgi:hypothetical protein
MLSELDVRKLVKANNRSVHVTDEFVTCLIYKECKFDPRPNDDGSSAAGLMQIMPPAISDVNRSLQAGAPRYKPSDVNDDAKCIQMATLYIDLRIRSFGGDIAKGVDHYGTGPGYSKGIFKCEACLKKTPLGAPLPCLLLVDRG